MNDNMITLNHWKSASTTTQLTENSVHIWKLSLLQSGETSPSDVLSKDEIQKAERFHFTEDKHKFILTRTMLRDLLSRYTGVAANELVFSYNEYGKPFILTLNKKNAVFFNVTHSKDKALFAFSRQCELGIDIEHMRDNVKYLELAKRFFSQQEFQALALLSGNDLKLGFYRCWTRKEAFIKAVGDGLSFSLSKFAVNLDDDDNPRLLWADKTRFAGTCHMYPVLHDEHYFASLACLCKPEYIDFYHCAPDPTIAN